MKAYSPSAYPKVVIIIFWAASLSFPQSPQAPAIDRGKPAQKAPASAEDSTRKNPSAEKASLLAELRSLEIESGDFKDPSAEALAKAEIADAAWQLDRDWSKTLLRAAYKLVLPKAEKSSDQTNPAGSIPPAYDGPERARMKVRRRVLEVARRDKELVNELIQLEAEGFGVYGKYSASAVVAGQALQAGDFKTAADYVIRGIETDPTQITAPSVISEMREHDREMADSLTLRYLNELRSFPLSSSNQSDIRTFYALSMLVSQRSYGDPKVTLPPPSPEVMRAYIAYMLEALAALEQSDPGYLQRRRRLLLSLWVPLQQYAPDLSGAFLALDARSRRPGDTSALPTAASVEEEQRRRYEGSVGDALSGGQPSEAVIQAAISRGDFDKARKMIGKLPDGERKRLLTDAANAEEALRLASKGDVYKAEALAEELTSAASILRVYPVLVGKALSGKDQPNADRLVRRAIQRIKGSDTSPPPAPEGIPQWAASGDPRLDPVLSFIAKLAVEILPYNSELAFEVLDGLVSEANAKSEKAGTATVGFDANIFKRLAPKNAARVQQDAFSLNNPVQRVLALAAIYQWKAAELNGKKPQPAS